MRPKRERGGTNGDGAKMFNDRQDVPAIEHLRTQTPSKMGPLLYPVPAVPEFSCSSVVPELYTTTTESLPGSCDKSMFGRG